MTSDELDGVIDLTIIGTIDARDFKTIRDYMPLLVKLDLSQASVVAYIGTDGTFNGIDTSYPENGIPDYAFLIPNTSIYPSIKILALPSTVTSIGNYAFYSWRTLTSLIIPPSVKSIGNYAFQFCDSLTSIIIPSSVISIGDYAFEYCSKLNKVIVSNSVTSIGDMAFAYCSSLNKFRIPNSLTSIGNFTFEGGKMTSLTIPNSVTSIGNGAFYLCLYLKSIYSYSTTPVNLNSKNYVFDYVNKTTCTLYVPKGSKSAYQAATLWKDFTKIVEMKDFALSTNTVKMSVTGNPVSVSVTSNTTWTVSSDQSWLTVSPTFGNGTVTFTAQAYSGIDRTATVTVTPIDAEPQDITVIQGGLCTKSITVNAGELSTSLTSTELAVTNDLTILGTIDARDFKTMRDNMPRLEKVDLSDVKVLAYTGTEGTDVTGVSKTYQANLIPQNAFYSANTNTGKVSLISVLMPSSVTSIGNFAFYLCKGLASINITSAISSMGSFSFGNCAGLNDINVESGNFNYSAIDGVLFDKNQTKLIQYPNNKHCNNYVVPSTVTSIEEFAFYFCSSLSSTTIPNTVTSIGRFALANCSGLKSIYVYSSTPLDLGSSIYVFSGTDDICTLHVPKGSIVAYQAAYQWQDFAEIIEMTTTDLSINTIQKINLYPNPTTDAFQISGIEGLVMLRLLDINGRLLLTRQVTGNESVSVSSLPKGLYIVKLITADGTLERKVIKK